MVALLGPEAPGFEPPFSPDRHFWDSWFLKHDFNFCSFRFMRLPRRLSSYTFVPAQTFSIDELFATCHALHWWEESHTQTIVPCVVRPRRKRASTEDVRTSTASTFASLKHHSLQLLREYHLISCLTMPIMGRDILQTLATSEEALDFVVFPSQIGGTDPEGGPEPG